ncbi:hypothetical protein ACFL5V_07330 [Fibrobacterota bacterium]
MKRLFLHTCGRKMHSRHPELGPNSRVFDLDAFDEKQFGTEVPDRSQFETQYRDFIASLCQYTKNRYWWGSGVCEKNTLTSSLYPDMYKLLCVDRFLKRNSNNVHIICCNPVLACQISDNYGPNYSVQGVWPSRLRLLKRKAVLTLKGILKQLAMAGLELKYHYYARRSRNALRIKGLGKGPLTVIRTWVDHRNYKNGGFSDSYFGRLGKYLASKGRPILVFAGIGSGHKEMFLRLAADRRNRIIPYNSFLKPFDIFKCLIISLFGRPGLSMVPSFGPVAVERLICYELSRDIHHGVFFKALVQHFAAFRLAESAMVDNFYITFENYCWEKLTISGLRRAKSDIRITGWQHAFISRNSFQYFPGEAERYAQPLPSSIITLGSRTKSILEERGCYPDSLFTTGCALRQEYLFNREILPRRTAGIILVPLTITVEDAVAVINFLMEAGMETWDEELVLRFHPATSKKLVLREVGRKLPGNFKISSNPPLAEEVEACHTVLYTMTKVCLEALRMGRPVIYLDLNYPMDMDPLFECRHLKDSCRRPADLAGKLEALRTMPDNEFVQERDRAGEYLREYFYPVNEEGLRTFL